jgi:hypothetical protein
MQTQINCPEHPALTYEGEQCRECGLRLSGPLAGRAALDQRGGVVPLVGYRPTVCNACREAWLTSRQGS